MYYLISLIIIVIMMLFICFGARKAQKNIIYCKKSELLPILDDIPDDEIIELWIGGRIYEHRHPGSS